MKIIPNSNYDYQIGILICEMQYVRNETLELTRNMSVSDLDFNIDNKSNSVGTLLLHIATIEYKFVLNFLLKRAINEKEFQKYGIAMPHMMQERLVNTNTWSYYKNELELVRNETFKELKPLKDEWLFEEVLSSQGKSLGNHFYFLRHILHDELCHQGQIKMILKRL